MPDEASDPFAQTDDGARRDKGKARARTPEPTERTPLLRSPTPPALDDENALPPAHARRRGWRSTLALLALSTALVALLLVGALALLAQSYASRAARLSDPDTLARALVVRGPDHVSVLNITQPADAPDGRAVIWVLVHGRAGLDLADALGVRADVDPAAPDGLPTYAWKALGRWGVARLGAVSVSVRGVRVAAGAGARTPLVDIDAPVPVALPMRADSPRGVEWLAPLAVPMRVRPTDNGDALIDFAKASWMAGYVDVRATVAAAHVEGGSPAASGWRTRLQLDRSNVSMAIRKQIPTIPGMPTPGRDAPLPDLSRLVTLQGFNLTTVNDTLHIDARATAINPVPDYVDWIVPPLPFTVGLPSEDGSTPIPLAAVHSAPLSLAVRPNLTIALAGRLLALPQEGAGGAALNGFLQRYLSGRPSNVSISSPLAPNITLPSVFPAPVPPPRVLRELALQDMRAKPARGGGFVVSGRVTAHVVLPRGMRFALAVPRVLPDVLVFDGPVPPEVAGNLTMPALPAFPHGPHRDAGRGRGRGGGDGDDDAPPAPPLPDPLPEGAFAHIRPEDWLPALSVPMPPDDEAADGSAVAVSAQIVDVPLAILPGREHLARAFLGKLVFGKSALAGLQGTVAVTAQIGGLPGGKDGGVVELEGLPFKGEVRFGTK